VGGATRLLESLPAWPAKRMPFWLIVRHGPGGLEPLTTEFTDGRKALGIFSFEEEARLFQRLGTCGGWRVRATGIAELLSVLYGPCRGMELVALDQLPQREAEAVNRLLCVDRERFVGFLQQKRSGH
jgi:hypothetical protein